MKKYSQFDDDIPFGGDERPFYKKAVSDSYANLYKIVCLTFYEKTKNYVAGAKPTVYPEIVDSLWRYFQPPHMARMAVGDFQNYSLESTLLRVAPDRLCALAFDSRRINPYSDRGFDEEQPVNAFTGLPNLEIRSRGLSRHEKEYRDLCEIRDTVLSKRKNTYKKAGVTYHLGISFEQQLQNFTVGVSIICELTEAWLQRSAQIREFNKKGRIEYLLSGYLPDRQIEMISKSKRIFADCIEQMYEYLYKSLLYQRGSEIDLVYGRSLSALQTERYHALSDAKEREGRGAQTEIDYPLPDPRRDSRNWRGAYGEEVYEPEFGGSDEYDPYRDENPPKRHPSFLRRCVVDVAPRVGVGRAFGICTSTMKKAGYYDENGDLTEKGRKRQRHFSAQKDMREYDEKYERLLAAARKK